MRAFMISAVLAGTCWAYYPWCTLSDAGIYGCYYYRIDDCQKAAAKWKSACVANPEPRGGSSASGGGSQAQGAAKRATSAKNAPVEAVRKPVQEKQDPLVEWNWRIKVATANYDSLSRVKNPANKTMHEYRLAVEKAFIDAGKDSGAHESGDGYHDFYVTIPFATNSSGGGGPDTLRFKYMHDTPSGMWSVLILKLPSDLMVYNLLDNGAYRTMLLPPRPRTFAITYTLESCLHPLVHAL